VRFVIGKTLSRLLTAYYRAPDHPMKLRVWRYIRELSRYAPLTVEYGHGRWITLDERDWLQSRILSGGAYEPEVWAALAGCASGDEVVWDVGAHIGSFTLTATQDSRVRLVCAFEPDPANLRSLHRNLALNRTSTRVFPFALSDAPGQGRLIHGPPDNSGMSTFTPSASTGMTQHTRPGARGLAVYAVQCQTADALIAQDAAPVPTLMKIDVEGWEYHVLCGARGLLASRRLKALVIESAADRRGHLEDTRLEELLQQFDYSLSRIERPTGELLGVENYVAVRR
jgi:FkbM family methyltransferase